MVEFCEFRFYSPLGTQKNHFLRIVFPAQNPYNLDMQKLILWTLLFLPVFALGGDFDRQSDTRTATFDSIANQRKDWGLDMDFGLTLNRGNVDRTVGSAGFNIFDASEALTAYLSGSYYYGAFGSARYDHKANATLRFDFRMSPFWKIFIFSTHAFNEPQKIDYRATNGIGPWIDFGDEQISNGLSVAIVHEFENPKDAPVERIVRLSFRDMLTIKISESARAGYDFFVAPALEDFSDFRVFFQPYIEAKISEVFSLKYKVSFERDNQPQPGVEKNDVENLVQFSIHAGQ